MNDLRLSDTVRIASETTEIVRGQEHRFLEQLDPIVRNKSVDLDLSPVERIDAAGIAALIRLYCDATQAGRRFRILNPRPHVQEILSIVGIDRILMAESTMGMQLTAA